MSYFPTYFQISLYLMLMVSYCQTFSAIAIVAHHRTCKSLKDWKIIGNDGNHWKKKTKQNKKTLICISNISDVHGYFLVTAVWHPLLGSPNQLTGSLTQFKLQCEDFTPLCCLTIRLAEISFCFLSHLLFHCVQLSMVCAHSINLSHYLYASKLNESTTVATVSTGP